MRSKGRKRRRRSRGRKKEEGGGGEMRWGRKRRWLGFLISMQVP